MTVRVRVGFIMLCHQALDRAAEVARFWAAAGAPVVVHVDRIVPADQEAAFRKALADLPHVRFSERFRCEWGTFGLVAATLAAAERLLDAHPDLTHVYLASGACLPLRPLGDLVEYLAEHADTDFIESVTTDDVPWIIGGLAMERFTLRFPFPWRTRRALFDGYVRLQRRLGFRRRMPEGITPHLGSQWWCLTRRTLASIIEDPRRPELDRYFRKVWIPDESYFQTLARRFATRIESRSLTLSKFDFEGRPHTFYDDHLQLLRRSDCFVARKIWPKADKLYEAFLDGSANRAPQAEPQPGKIDRLFAQAVERRRFGRAGLYMQSRYPLHDHENGKTSAAYSVFHGFSDLFENFEDWLAGTVGSRVHGHLFAPQAVGFAGQEPVYNGALPASVAIRDYNARAFLTGLIWSTRGERQIFQFSPRDSQACNAFIADDPNAQVSVISGAWAIPLFRATTSFAELRSEAARLQRIESAHLALLRSVQVKARVRIWTLAEFLEAPMENVTPILDEIMLHKRRTLSEVPRLVDLDGFGQFLQNLKNQGMQPHLMGDFPVSRDWRPAHAAPPSRPYLVR